MTFGSCVPGVRRGSDVDEGEPIPLPALVFDADHYRSVLADPVPRLEELAARECDNEPNF